jgi:hypothetical protein
VEIGCSSAYLLQSQEAAGPVLSGTFCIACMDMIKQGPKFHTRDSLEGNDNVVRDLMLISLCPWGGLHSDFVSEWKSSDND